LPFDEPELDELELDEESEPDEPDELDESEDEDDEAPTDSVLLADPLDELPAAVLAASRLSLR
jgi:TATA-binding protein-associated factor Taf7